MGIIGSTGKFPDGKVKPDDEGELSIALTSENGLIMVYFGKRITWLGLRPQDARAIAAGLIEQANKIEGVD